RYELLISEQSQRRPNSATQLLETAVGGEAAWFRVAEREPLECAGRGFPACEERGYEHRRVSEAHDRLIHEGGGVGKRTIALSRGAKRRHGQGGDRGCSGAFARGVGDRQPCPLLVARMLEPASADIVGRQHR